MLISSLVRSRQLCLILIKTAAIRFGLILPKPHRIKLARIEPRTGITVVFLSRFLGYWLIRLCFFTKELYLWVM